jgi:hypothetical protein
MSVVMNEHMWWLRPELPEFQLVIYDAAAD